MADSTPLPVVDDWVDPRYPPEIRLFFSVDIEGSTLFKNSVLGGRSTWGPFFLDFFKDFPSCLRKAESDQTNLLAIESATKFEFWKSLGDELVFSKPLRSGFDVFIGLCAAREAVIQGAARLRKHKGNRSRSDDHDYYPCHLKGTAWLAGFPIKNMRISPDEGGKDDYIGPSIDLGFRLGKLSSPWRMTISAPLAWMAAKVQHEQSAKLKGQNLKWSYLGRHDLKGVGSEKNGYPVFCIDVADSATGINAQERNLLERNGLTPRDVVDFCETLFHQSDERVGSHGKPFILHDVDCGLGFPRGGSPDLSKYQLDYSEFLTTQPVLTQPEVSQGGGSDDTAAILLAIDSATSVNPDGTI